MRTKVEYAFTLCAGRHETPAHDYIFSEVVDPTDLDAMFKVAWERIPDDCTDLTVYVTGLTPAMLTLVEVCWQRRINLIAMHFNRESGSYYPQELFAYTKCPWCGSRVRGGNGFWVENYCPNCGGN